jgi:hypothetical protein
MMFDGLVAIFSMYHGLTSEEADRVFVEFEKQPVATSPSHFFETFLLAAAEAGVQVRTATKGWDWQ